MKLALKFTITQSFITLLSLEMAPEVIIDQGTLRGSLGKDYFGKNFYKFQGIPYAKPPLGNLRFKAPQPPEKWQGIFDASKEKDVSYARDLFDLTKIVGSENCLYLNVFTRQLPEKKADLKPVLFWIHGGGFVFGSGNEDHYGPEFLITQDIVLVTINYRLGLLGFASFDDPSLEVPGNAGLKDQVMALKWVQKNIARFGGNPNNVTIFGESAGAGSSHLLMLSPLAKGLFHKAICQSGCAINPWARSQKSTPLLAKVLKVPEDEKIVFGELLKKTTEEIFEVQEQLGESFNPSHLRAIGLVIEKNSKNAFLDKEPLEIINSGKYHHVPLLIGYNSKEGMFAEMFRNPNGPDVIQIEDYIPFDLNYTVGTPEIKNVVQNVKDFYFNGQEYSEELIQKKYDLITDTFFYYGIYTIVTAHLNNSKEAIFFYRLNLQTELNVYKNHLKITASGTSHLDDIGYLFKQENMPDIKKGSIEEISMTKMVKLWTNFAKYGNPTPLNNDPILTGIWEPVSNKTFSYFDIDNTLSTKSDPDIERINFWKKIYAEKSKKA